MISTQETKVDCFPAVRLTRQELAEADAFIDAFKKMQQKERANSKACLDIQEALGKCLSKTTTLSGNQENGRYPKIQTLFLRV